MLKWKRRGSTIFKSPLKTKNSEILPIYFNMVITRLWFKGHKKIAVLKIFCLYHFWESIFHSDICFVSQICQYIVNRKSARMFYPLQLLMGCNSTVLALIPRYNYYVRFLQRPLKQCWKFLKIDFLFGAWKAVEFGN